MKLGELIEKLRKELQHITDSHELEAHLRILLQHFLGLNRAETQLNKTKEIDKNKVDQLDFAVGELQANRPLDYIIEESVFLGYPFYVNEAVLIPRPETEELVMLVAENETNIDLSILDIGTGSACIPIGLAMERDYREIEACEVSEAALEVAQINVEKMKVQVKLFLLDILRATPSRKYDVVVSNPPYVLQEEIQGLEKHVKEYEPLIALTPNGEPLLFYKRMIDIADQILNPNGRFYWEIHEDLGKEVCQLFENKPFEKVALHQDMYGRDRFVSAVFRP